jgi:hypothetical protein
VFPVAVEVLLAVVLAQTLKDAKFVPLRGLGAIGDLILGCASISVTAGTVWALYSMNLPLMQCGVISSLHGPVTRN